MNQELELLRPTRRHRIYDLVRVCGVNVDDWSDFKGGHENASRNPKYCYEWAFVEEGRFVVLSLWYDKMEISGDKVIQEPNPRGFAESLEHTHPKPGTVISRALRMDKAIKRAYQESLPIKVIVCDGSRKDRTKEDSRASSVNSRKLDPVPWAVSTYDASTGNCVITRGVIPNKVFDQYSIPPDPTRKKVTEREVFCRDRKQRDAALQRASGHCEYCSEVGFETNGGHFYLETHHVVPLSEGGADDESNIVALCANDHREAHYGVNRDELREALEDILSRYYC